MEKKKSTKVLILGSGALKIGEAGEFDYSGSQAIKALREESVDVVLINPNIATNQTSRSLINKIYFLPVTPYFIEKVIRKEKPDGILLGFGGQTALNAGLTLHKQGVFAKYKVEVLGSPVSSIEKTEDRSAFRKYIESLGLKVPKSTVCKDIKDLREISAKINFPVIVRSGFSLGGLGSGVARNKSELRKIAEKALLIVPHILIEEYLENWKELEYEVVRDKSDNTIVVCNMENFDPMGIHTGESIVVAPSQTLTNNEYHFLRKTAIEIVKNLPIIGECNVQFALNPQNGDYRVIEVNARLSRSSALASKATGYPLAYVAAKLALGYTLDQIPNQVTGVTTAFFEPALDYVVVKIPRWDFVKFNGLNEEKIGSEMQSVGEVMSIGRTFEEAFQKGIRSLDLSYEGIISDKVKDKNKKNKFKTLHPTPSRPYNIAYNLYFGMDVLQIYKKTGIDTWFLERIKRIVDHYRLMSQPKSQLNSDILEEAKKLGFSDKQIGEIYKKTPEDIRRDRKKYEILPKVCQIDTLAGEFPAQTNYLYLSYHREDHDVIFSEEKDKVAVLGGGPYKIGSSVEFDWCAVNSVVTAKKMGYETIVVNNNPETVSTDYDFPDRLYFEELSWERIQDIYDLEKCKFIISMGGQIPNSLVPSFEKGRVPTLGTKLEFIDAAENREKFSILLDKIGVKQPVWKKLTNKKDALKFAHRIGFPVLIRPSYVLSGSAMFVAYFEKEFEAYLSHTGMKVDNDYPLVISKYYEEAKEVDLDGVAKNGKIVLSAISEHVENAGVHSGDAILVYPAFSLGKEIEKELLTISGKIAHVLSITGPFNIQFLIDKKDKIPKIRVIETNLRASRSMPFISKASATNFIGVATEIMLGGRPRLKVQSRPDYFCIKSPHFSFTRIRKADPVLRVEMSSTGEVASFGKDIYEAYLLSFLSTGLSFPKGGVLLSLGGLAGKRRMLSGAAKLHKLGFKIYATGKTAKFLNENYIPAKLVYKVHEGKKPDVVDVIQSRKVGLVINLSDDSEIAIKEVVREYTDGYLIRRAAVDNNIHLITRAESAILFIEALTKYGLDDLDVYRRDEYLAKLQSFKIQRSKDTKTQNCGAKFKIGKKKGNYIDIPVRNFLNNNKEE
ncbi:MAG: Carbamoyl-phosphate synthase, large subunit [Candidatus Gottesmanbacteria bacterium GW2011_GWC2_39_8]|uniref:Carbamoyl phosphate synthase arginine-specific large chain n=1 Tax=Candidatus Gottesmanbacteria bacterium GW2011_GWC2_39_8 TaxID=1618450 RepID=A0A0G0Q116_9BACT|nr:MAG: Carbamoyl-phosphate synthase, large subunit [Candidatus Gottesmanbacteria bacterium GW2011_GWC2_39_8]